MSTIPSTVTVQSGASKDVSFRVKAVKFGDGYEHRVKDGINTIRELWKVTFTQMTEAEAVVIEAVLKEAAGVIMIDWQSPDQSVPGQWLARSYSVNRQAGKVVEISVEFDSLTDP